MPTLTLHPGATVLVTGINGLLGSHVADQLLARGYKVRGAVRGVGKNAWVRDYFVARHPGAGIELVDVPDITAPGCYDEAVKGVQGIVHLASPLGGEDADALIRTAVEGGLNALRAAAKEKGIKRFVYTSSSVAAVTPKPDTEVTVRVTDFNEEGIRAGRSKDRKPGLALYSAMKTEAEKACWEWVRENEPGFAFSSVLPNVNFGEVLVPEEQGAPSTVEWAKMAFTGQGFDMLAQVIMPQWFINNADCALLHVGALIYEDVSGERLFGFAEPFNWNDVLAGFRKLYPEKSFPKDRELGIDVSNVPNKRALEVLEWIKEGKGWTGLKESLAEMSENW
ncbi:dihydroflavonol-4-reductase [Corynespora cassiicola Philippines]|uniref:Dihydroflavonol-4-reductase n=1 Tax=Corynespora cassiicola Philippines TaxID=1448308 RepID=A0A2T2NMQ3_CORCC|nr:dihydroflavonol-4-reductase [Corynespora cassiicola Philippines]